MSWYISVYFSKLVVRLKVISYEILCLHAGLV